MTSGEREVLAQIERGERPTFPAGFLDCGWDGADDPVGSFKADKPGKLPRAMTPKERDRYLDSVLKRWAKNGVFEGIRGTRVSIAVAVEKGLPLEVNEWPAECAA